MKKAPSMDGFVSVAPHGRVSLLADDGKLVAARGWRPNDSALGVDHSTILGNWECLLTEEISVAKFDSGAILLESTGPSAANCGAIGASARKAPRPLHPTLAPQSATVDGGASHSIPLRRPGICAREFGVRGLPSAASSEAVAAGMRRPVGPPAVADGEEEELILNRGAPNEWPVRVERSLACRLRPHQLEGVQFMYDCLLGRRRDLQGKALAGCILAHSMGLGKTLQVLVLVHTLLRCGPRSSPGSSHSYLKKAVIICPASLAQNWEAECTRWIGRHKLAPVLVESGKDAAHKVRDFVRCAPQKLLIISYENFRGHAAALRECPIGLLVCDEGQRLKEAKGNKTIDALRSLTGAKRIILTGTPMQNDLDELWAMSDFACPGGLPDLPRFRQVFGAPLEAGRQPKATEAEKAQATARGAHLRELVETFMQSRDRSVLDSLLPERREIVICCRLLEAQADAYRAVLQEMRSADGDGQAQLTALIRLRTVCSANYSSAGDALGDGGQLVPPPPVRTNPRGLAVPGGLARAAAAAHAPPAADEPTSASSKLRVLLQLIEPMRAAGDRVVIASQFQASLDLIEGALKAKGLSSLRVDGKVDSSKRQHLVDRFNSPSSVEMAFLLSTRAGGTGFNLIGANRLIMFDPDWNPAADEQAMARIFRDGQKRNVTIWRMLSAATVEEKMYQRQLFKQDLGCGIVGAETSGSGASGGRKSENKFSKAELADLYRYDKTCPSSTHQLLMSAAGVGAQEAARLRSLAHWSAVLPDPLLRTQLGADESLKDVVTFACDVAELHALRSQSAQADPNEPEHKRQRGALSQQRDERLVERGQEQEES